MEMLASIRACSLKNNGFRWCSTSPAKIKMSRPSFRANMDGVRMLQSFCFAHQFASKNLEAPPTQVDGNVFFPRTHFQFQHLTNKQLRQYKAQ
jgi:hypothetical protein